MYIHPQTCLEFEATMIGQKRLFRSLKVKITSKIDKQEESNILPQTNKVFIFFLEILVSFLDLNLKVSL